MIKLVKRRSPPSKGWKSQSPKQRILIKKKCGSKCFLRPKDNGFPVCTSNCTYSCKGLAAAKSRAGKHGYLSIKDTAHRKALLKGCDWAKRSPKRKSRSPKRKLRSSPKRKSRSPKRKSRSSPKRKSRSPKRKSRSSPKRK